MKKDYETPRVEFFRVEEFVICTSGFGYEEEDENPW